MLTETEAKAKWCHVAFTTPHWRKCSASECMAWRWQPLMVGDDWADAVKKAAAEIGDASPSRVKAARHVNANRAVYGLPDKPFAGFCGLAFKPEGVM